MRRRLNWKKTIIALVIIFVIMFTILYRGEDKSSYKNTNNGMVNGLVENKIRAGARTGNPAPTGTGQGSPTISSISGGGTKYLALGEKTSFTFTAYSSTGSNVGFSPTWSVTGPNGSMSGSTLNINGKDTGGKDSNCKTTTYTVTASTTDPASSASVEASVCVYCKAWDCKSGKFYYNSSKNTSPEGQGCGYFTGESKTAGGYLYSGYCTRCCGDNPPQPDGACYGDKEYLGLALDAKWYLDENLVPKGYYKYKNIKNPDECAVKKVNLCSASTPGNNVQRQTVKTDQCEDSKSVTQVDRISCGQFYRIVCTKTINTKFDFGDDGSNSTSHVLYKGQGFRFGVVVNTDYSCDAQLYPNVWKSAYNRLIDKVKAIDSSLVTYIENNNASGWQTAVSGLKAKDETKKEVYELWYELVEVLRNIVAKDYLKFDPSSGTKNENVNFTMNFNTADGKTVKIDNAFVKSESESQDGVYTRNESSEKVSFKMKLNDIPTSYTVSNNNSRIIKYVPERAYIDRYANMDSDKQTVDGGNKIYVNYDIKPTSKNQSYKMTVTYSGFDSVKSSISDEKCSVTVKDGELNYRPIDVSNPTINSSHGIGENWYNSLYNFINLIDENTWSSTKRTQYDIVMPASKVVKLKESTSRLMSDGYSPYLGMCSGIKESLQDNITKEICAIINK